VFCKIHFAKEISEIIKAWIARGRRKGKKCEE